MDDTTRISVLLIDEHHDVCERLAQAIGSLSGIELVGATTNVVLGAELAHQSKPDIILADFAWGSVPRPEKLGWIARMSPSASVLSYSSFYREGERDGFAAAGAAKCLLKGLPLKELANQIRAVAASRDALSLS